MWTESWMWILGSCDRASWAKCEEREKTNKMLQLNIINFCLNMFRASLCPSSGEHWPGYCIWCTALVLLDVVGSGCGALRCRMRALWRFLFAVCSEIHTKHTNTILIIPKSDCYLRHVYLSICQSVLLSFWNNSAPTEWIFTELNIWMFFLNLSRKFKFH